MSEKEKKLSTEPYKGVRDFYPEDMFVQNYIFNTMRKAVEKFGYLEYNASVLEPAELYKAKTGEEIVNEQTYTFTDRGDRQVTLRPEMTPTVARMVAAKKMELPFPLRWYSIPNLFRYEKPQRGRLREHWQLNVDVFGLKTIQAEVEAISVAREIMKSFGLKDAQFEIRINNRKIMNYILNDVIRATPEEAYKISKLIDKKAKMERSVFEAAVSDAIGGRNTILFALLNSKNFSEFVSILPKSDKADEGIAEIKGLLQALEQLGITNCVFDQSLMRGFDYYTGVVFEIFDLNPENRRSLFGGGRYDDLLSIFGSEKVPAVGFGMGDVTIRDTLETYKLLPDYASTAKLYLCILDEKHTDVVNEMAQSLRESGIRVAVDYTGRKVGDQIKSAAKQHIPFLICIGDNEIETGVYKIKDLGSGKETGVRDEQIASFIAESE